MAVQGWNIFKLRAAKTMQLTVKNIDETKKFAKHFMQVLQPGILVCLYGPIGSGKTTFVQLACKNIGVTENVTSPSFVIINEYYSGKYPVYHFDLYRLEEEGISSIISELEEYSSDSNAVTFVEWAEFSGDNLLDDRLEIKFNYDPEFSTFRYINLVAHGNKCKELLERLEKEIVNCKL